MAHEQEFNVLDDEVKIEAPVIDAAPAGDSKLLEIISLIDDAGSDPVYVNRLIAREIAIASAELSGYKSDPTLVYRLPVVKERIKALRELARTLIDGDTISKKDILNFDGPKFQYAMREMVVAFKKAMKDAGVDDGAASAVLKTYRSIAASREEALRKEIDRIEGSAQTGSVATTPYYEGHENAE